MFYRLNGKLLGVYCERSLDNSMFFDVLFDLSFILFDICIECRNGYDMT